MILTLFLSAMWAFPSHASCESDLSAGEIHSGPLVFKRTTREDQEALYAVLQMPEVVATNGNVTRRELIASQMNVENKRIEYTIFMDGRIIGGVRATSLKGEVLGPPAKNGETWADIGYVLVPGVWGKGYGTEAARVAFDIANQNFHPQGFFTRTLSKNVASQKILRKLGYQELGEMDGSRYFVYNASESIRRKVELAMYRQLMKASPYSLKAKVLRQLILLSWGA